MKGPPSYAQPVELQTGRDVYVFCAMPAAKLVESRHFLDVRTILIVDS